MNRLYVPLAILILGACAFASPSPLGHISSTAPFQLNGAVVQVDGVPSWPVFEGDIVESQASPVTIVFLNGTRIVLAEHSKLKIEGKGKKTLATLLKGSAKYIAAGAVTALAIALPLVFTSDGPAVGALSTATTTTTLANPSPIAH